MKGPQGPQHHFCASPDSESREISDKPELRDSLKLSLSIEGQIDRPVTLKNVKVGVKIKNRLSEKRKRLNITHDPGLDPFAIKVILGTAGKT